MEAGKTKVAKYSLERRVVTRWNTDFDCLKSCCESRDQVMELMKVAGGEYDLEEYELGPSQWDIVKKLIPVLYVRFILLQCSVQELIQSPDHRYLKAQQNTFRRKVHQ